MEHPLVDRLLDAVLDPQDIARTLRVIASEFSANHLFAHLVTPQATGAFVSSDSEELLQFLAEWGEMNPRLARAMEFARSGQYGLLTDWRLFTPQEVARDPFEQDFARKYDAVHYAGSVIPVSAGSFFVLSFERSASKGAYVGEEERSLERFLNEAARSLRYALRGQAHLARTLTDSLSAEKTAHAWVDSEARLRHASPAFSGLMDRFLGERNGHLVPLDGDADAFRELIGQAALGLRNDLAVKLANPADRADVAVARAFPLKAAPIFAGLTADVLLSLEVSSAQIDLSRILSARHGLTPAEIRLVKRLNEGMSLRQAASAEDISYESSRTRLKAVFHKMSVSRQSELIRYIANL